MRTTLFASAALAAVVLAAPAFAQTVNIGYVGAAVGRIEIDDADATTYVAEGAVSLPVSGSLGLQFDAAFANADADGESVNTLGGRAHLFTRNESFLLGGFVGASRVDFGDDSDFGGDPITGYAVGAEAQAYLGQVTLGGSLAWDVSDEDEDEGEGDGVGADVDARYFVTDDFTLEAGLGYAEADEDDTTTFTLATEYKFGASPFSVRAGFSNSNLGEDFDVQTFLVGLRLNSTGTLRDRDRRGPSL